MYKLDQFKQKKEYLKYHMPFGRIINDPAVVLNKDGSIQTTWKYRGPDLGSSLIEQLGVITAQLNSSFLLLGTGWVIYLEAQRAPSVAYDSDVYFPDSVTRKIDEARREWFQQGNHYESNYYFTLYWMPPNDNEDRLRSMVIEGKERRVVGAEEHLKNFMNVINKMFQLFTELKFPAQYLSGDEMATYLHSTVSAENYAIRLPVSKPVLLDSILYDSPLSGGMEPMLGNKHMRVIVPLSFPPSSQFGLFDELNLLGFSYRWVTRYYCMDKTDALNVLGKVKKEWNSKVEGIATIIKQLALGPEKKEINYNASSKKEEVINAETMTEADEIGYGYYSTMLIILDENEKKADEKAGIVEQIFLRLGMKPKIEDLNAIDAWMASIPGNVGHHVRRPKISTGNLVHLTPLSDIWAGPSRNEYLNAPVLMHTQTTGNTPFRLSLHVGQVGHTLIVGPTGAGKSVLLNMIAAQFRKYKNAQVFFFDKGGSSRILTEAVGGQFYNIGSEGDQTSFQPLSQIDNEQERMWAQGWLCDYICKEKVEVTPKIKKSLWTAIESLAAMPVEYRTMLGLINTVQDQVIKDALRGLSSLGEYGTIFDSDKDSLNFSNWQTFEMENLLKTSAIVEPTLMYIFHRIEQKLKQRLVDGPTIIELDECWTFLQNPIFSNKILEWLKTLRKYNASVVFATQSLDDIIKSPILSTILESCQSRIFLPYDKAMEKDTREVYRTFGLNDRQIQIIANARQRKQYYYTSPLGSRVFELELDAMALAYVSVGKTDLLMCQKLIDTYGRENFVEHWERYKNIEKK